MHYASAKRKRGRRMAITNQERIGKAIDLLKAGLAPFVSREFVKYYDHEGRPYQALKRILGRPVQDRQDPFQELDTAALLAVMEKTWNEVFRNTLGRTERSLVLELQEVRIGWAHQKPFSDNDTYRALDSAHRLLKAISSPHAAEIEKLFRPADPVPRESEPSSIVVPPDDGDLVIVVPARKEPFNHLFLGQDGEHCWHEIRIAPAKRAKIKYVAAYRIAPVSAVTHFAPVKRIERYFGVSATALFGGKGQQVRGEKYKLIFSEPAREIGPIPKRREETKYPQRPLYTTMKKLKTAKTLADLW